MVTKKNLTKIAVDEPAKKGISRKEGTVPRRKIETRLPPVPTHRADRQKVLQQRVEETVKRIAAIEDYRGKTLAKLVSYARRERASILGDAAKKIATFREQERKSRKKYGIWSPQQRMARKVELVRYAQSLGVNTDALFRLNAYTRRRAELLMDKPAERICAPLSHHPAGDSFDENCQSYEHPFVGTFSTSFDSITGEGELRASESFLDANTATSGGSVRIRNWDADDNDSGWAYQENGFLTCYLTGARPGMIKITATFVCVESEVSMETEDEWGWSDCDIFVRTSARFAVYLEEPGDLDFTLANLAWWHYRGDGDDPNDIDMDEWRGGGALVAPFRRTANPGDVITVDTLSTAVLPARTLVGIYVGTRNAVSFWVNDVSVDATCSGRWFLRDFQVCQM